MTFDKNESRYICILLSITIFILTVESIVLIVQVTHLSERSVFLFDPTAVRVEATTHLLEFSEDLTSLKWKSERTEKFDDVLTTMTRRVYRTILPLRTVPVWRKGWIAEPVIDPNRTLWAAQGTEALYGYGGNLAYVFSP